MTSFLDDTDLSAYGLSSGSMGGELVGIACQCRVELDAIAVRKDATAKA